MTKQKNDFEQVLLHSQLEIQKEALKTFSQEIHNNIGQVLSLAKLQLSTLARQEIGVNTETIAVSQKLVGKAITDLRNLSKSLRPNRVNELGLENNIRYELNMLEKTGLYQIHMVVKGSPYTIPVHTQIILFRMIQVSINNIIKHTAANRVAVILDYNPDHFALIVQDNGIGLLQKNTQLYAAGKGLKTIQRRSAIIGAAFHLEQTPGGGTTLKISVPAVAA